jgi:hypothetical protein
MNLGEEYVGRFLAHYSSEYYDPQKAHEYYLQNRELKGQQSTADLTVKYATKSKRGNKTVLKVNKAASERRKEAWTYAKNQIGQHKKADLKALAEHRKQVVNKAQKTATARRHEITGKIKSLMDLLTTQKTAGHDAIDAKEKADIKKLDEDRAARSRKIREGANKQIDAIPSVPDGVRGAQRDRLVAARAEKIARIQGESSKQIDAVTKETATKREAISADADKQRTALTEQITANRASGHKSATVNTDKVSKQLKATVDKARADYEAGKKRLIADYEDKAQKEYDAIKARV